MSKFLKTIVNTVLVLAILVAGGLLIPPMVGVTTVIVDDIYMNTNLQQGSVTYAVDAKKPLKKGDKILIAQDTAQNVYKIADIQGDTYTLKDELSVDGTTEERTLNSTAKKVVFTIPFIGYISMALGTTEGLIIVGLGIVFLVILFILSEVWKKDDEEDDEEQEEETEEYEEEESLSRRERKKAAKKADKEAKKQEKKRKKEEQRKKEKKKRKEDKKAAKKADKKNIEQKESEMNLAQDYSQEEPEMNSVQDYSQEEPEMNSVEDYSQEERELFEETSDSLAAELASMMDQEEVSKDGLEETIENTIEDAWKSDKKEDTDFSIEQELMQAMEGTNDSEKEEPQSLEEQLRTELEESEEERIVSDIEEVKEPEEDRIVSDDEEIISNIEEMDESEEKIEELEVGEAPEEEAQEESDDKELAMPAYTKEELEQLIMQEGDSPRVIEDEESGITLFDYSDIL